MSPAVKETSKPDAVVTPKVHNEQARQRIDLPSDRFVFTAGESHNPDRGVYIYPGPVGGQKYLRKDDWELRYKGSPRFPKGIWIGVTCGMVQPDQGQPYVQDSQDPFTVDQRDELDAFAYNKPYRSMDQRRQMHEESQRRREAIAALSSSDLASTTALVNRAINLQAADTQKAAEAGPKGDA